MYTTHSYYGIVAVFAKNGLVKCHITRSRANIFSESYCRQKMRIYNTEKPVLLFIIVINTEKQRLD